MNLPQLSKKINTEILLNSALAISSGLLTAGFAYGMIISLTSYTSFENCINSINNSANAINNSLAIQNLTDGLNCLNEKNYNKESFEYRNLTATLKILSQKKDSEEITSSEIKSSLLTSAAQLNEWEYVQNIGIGQRLLLFFALWAGFTSIFLIGFCEDN